MPHLEPSLEVQQRFTLFLGTDHARLVDIDGPPSRALRGRPPHPRREPGWGAAPSTQEVPRVHVQPQRRKEQVSPSPPPQKR